MKRKPDILIHAQEGTLIGPVKSVQNADDAKREIDRLLGRQMFKRNKHQHEWTETQNEFTPPKMVVKKMSGYLSEDAQKIIFGYTRVTHTCKTCPEVNVKDYIGDVKTGTRT